MREIVTYKYYFPLKLLFQGENMIYEVDFSIKLNDSFCTVRKEMIYATSISECKHIAEKIKENIPENKQNNIYIFLEEL